MGFCTSCGANIPDGYAVCPSCGQPVAQPQQPQYAQPQQPQYAPQQQAGPMPNPTGALVMVIIGFLCGIIWGALALGHYNKMNNAIAIGDSMTANAEFKKVRTFFIIGIVISVLVIIGRIGAGV